MDKKLCANCGNAIQEAGERRVYCSNECRKKYRRRDGLRGKEALALLQVMLRYSHPRDEDERELGRYARQQAYELLRRYNAEDEAAGRDPERVIAPRHERGDLVIDKVAKPKLRKVTVEGIRQGLGA